MTLLDTPEGKTALEAGAKGAHAASSPGVPWETLSDLTREAWRIEIAPGILAALPHLRRALAEELRAEAVKFREMAAKDDEDAHRLRLGTCARVWDDAADHLTREGA